MDKKKKLILIAVSVCLFAGFAYFDSENANGSVLEYFVSMYTPSTASSSADVTSSTIMTFGQ